jgi:two-component system, response regulator
VRTLRILLVEDDDDHVFLIRRALADLADLDVSVEVAADGERATERLARARFEPGGRPQLVLLDLKMPRMDGFEVLRRLRADEAARGLPVVVLTSSERQEDREEALRLGPAGSCASRPTAAASAPRSSSWPGTGPGSQPDGWIW